MATDSTIIGYEANIYCDDSTAPHDIDLFGVDVPEGMTVTGRINHSQPRIAVIDSGPQSLRTAMIAAKHRALVDIDYGPLEERITCTREPIPMDDMEKVYRYQQEAMKEVNLRHYLGEDGQRHGLGRKNGHRGSRAAKDHRSATKRQRSARKKNRKK